MTCEKLINDFLLDYVEGRLPVARRVEFDLHLALCSHCRRYLASYRQTVELAKVSNRPAAPPAPPELIDAILKVTRSS